MGPSRTVGNSRSQVGKAESNTVSQGAVIFGKPKHKPVGNL